MKLIIDSHLDLAWNALGWDRDLTLHFDRTQRRGSRHERQRRSRSCDDLFARTAQAGVAVCLATVLARVNPEAPVSERQHRRGLDYGHPAAAYAMAQGQLAYYRLLEVQGEIEFLHTAEDLQRHWQRWQRPTSDKLPVGIILAMEGADPIVSPDQAESWWRDGLRSLSLAHYGPSRYAVGSGDTGPLTAQGRQLLAEMERLGMILDVTHLSEPGFTEALELFGGPLMASHNNCRALVPGDRQFSDEQIRRLVERDTVIGVALDAWMLYPGWQKGRDVARCGPHRCRRRPRGSHLPIVRQLSPRGHRQRSGRRLRNRADAGRPGLDRRSAEAGRDSADRAAIRTRTSTRVFHGNWLDFFERRLPQGI